MSQVSSGPAVVISQVGFASLSPTAPLRVPAELRLPPGKDLPAVVGAHDSSGIDSRGRFHIEALNRAGIATLEIDMWTPRGVTGGANRPRGVPETLPDTCARLVAATDIKAPGIASLAMYPGATHAFDWSGPEITISEPFSHLGAGGDVTFRHKPDAAEQARAALVAFFRSKL